MHKIRFVFQKNQFQNNPASSLNCKETPFQENLPESASGPFKTTYKTNVQNDPSKRPTKRMCKTTLQNDPTKRSCKTTL
ncbi:predicted protein [Methanosarcina acetivorans C2A]|uniref:Uncharacterized protein n=1 Tax=Methanosarcina acetivorans (strain ATCC 35395 / DSM 2834 / JCM 12185 / C2A) TaxID=188937 RepID=Q8THG0_METAC|nr:predicted protein [Methanosarcina acetivorans C2A]